MNEKKTAALFVSIFIVCAFLAGCKNINIPCQTCENYATLQGTIMDAITGERIGGIISGKKQDIQIYLIQGATIRTPTSFISDVNNPLVGEYAFTNVPAGSSLATGNSTNPTDPEHNEYKIVVIKEGYQRFEGIVDLWNIDNMIGNIYLFPENFHTPDYTFTVVYTDDGSPVDNATVLFQPKAASNSTVTGTGNVLAPATGYLPSLQAKTDAKGQVTFAGSQLALGATYSLTVLPIVFEGVHLGITGFAYNFTIGVTTNTDIVYLNDLELYPYGLYVTEISNSVPTLIDPSGTLTITFNIPVTLGARPAPATANFGATGTVAGFNASSGVLNATTPVNAVLSADGLTLTLTPNWTTPPAATDYNTAIQYLNGTGYLSVQGYPGSFISLTSLEDAYGTAISRTVRLTTP